MPVLDDRNGRRGESWDHFTQVGAPLFAGGERGLAHFFGSWFSGEILKRMFAVLALDIYKAHSSRAAGIPAR